jgi:hypothetical protein
MKELRTELYRAWAEKLNYHVMHDLFDSLETHVYWELDDLLHDTAFVDLNNALQQLK